MMIRRASLLIALPAVLGLLHPAALAEPPDGAPPDPGSDPAAAAGALEATLDELAERVEQLSREAGRRAGFEDSQAEAQLDAVREGLEQLNAEFAATEGAADPNPAPPAPPSADDPDAGDGEPAYYAATDPVNLRAAPRNGAEVLAVVGAGELVRRIGRDGGWLRVRYSNQFAADFTGWVYGDFLRSAAPPADS